LATFVNIRSAVQSPRSTPPLEKDEGFSENEGGRIKDEAEAWTCSSPFPLGTFTFREFSKRRRELNEVSQMAHDSL
jgi:hypothetical protein